MSRSNVPLTVGVVAATVVVAAAIAIYESPEVRAFALETRRKIAVAFHALGDEIAPNSSSNANQNQRSGEPRFNRPEDAEGFYEAGVDANDENRRLQREELMYWNQLRLEKEARKAAAAQKKNGTNTASPQFEDFLQEGEGAARGTMVYNSGADINNDIGLMQRRANGIRELGAAGAYGAGELKNPFSDSNTIEMEEVKQERLDEDLMAQSGSTDFYGAHERNQSDVMSQTTDIYGVSEAGQLNNHLLARSNTPTLQNSPVRAVDVYDSTSNWANDVAQEADVHEPFTAMLEVSELENISYGDLTPTDSMSVIDDDVVAADDMSVSDMEGIHTPDSWSEVGSVVSEVHA